MRGLEEEEDSSTTTTTISGSTTTMTTSCSTEGVQRRSYSEDSATVSSVSEVASDEKVRAKKEQLIEKKKPEISEIDMMKERFAKLLLGEDMSGSGKGVSTALAISNAITNLFATVFVQVSRLEPLAPEMKTMWRREIEWLLCVSDYIVELAPSWQTFPDGVKHEVMTCRPRSDLFINLPALRKLDNMLIEILDSFHDTEFWYVDKGVLAPDSDIPGTFQKPLQRQEEKWWLPIPRVPPGGLSEKFHTQLQHKRESTNQILKAVMTINANVLDEIDVPDSYLESLPKNGKTSLGDVIHGYITSEKFSPECLLDCLDLSSEHQALEIANRVEAASFIWRRKTTVNKPKSSWGIVREFMVDAEKRELLSERAETLLLCLKQRFPALTQTTLDMSKIQYNKDVGKSILESYSRVLESLAFNIIARIDDIHYVDGLTQHSEKLLSVPIKLVSSTPYVGSAYTTPGFSPIKLVGSATGGGGGDKSPLVNRISTQQHSSHHRLGVKKVLTDYLSADRLNGNSNHLLEPTESMNQETYLKSPRMQEWNQNSGIL